MEQFRKDYEKKLKIANVLFAVGGLAFFSYIFSVFFISDGMYDFINKWGIDGLVPVFSGITFGFWLKCRNVLNSETAFEKAFLKETDERLVNIRTKASLWASYVMIYLIGSLTIILYQYDKKISFILFGILSITVIVEHLSRKILSKKL